ncbi:MAG TPA: hypothetical protein VGR78_15710 [Verrucomicrobiae bacterium]|nr:hypothetical protein [Verrucomicrobiae bacterium]
MIRWRELREGRGFGDKSEFLIEEPLPPLLAVVITREESNVESGSAMAMRRHGVAADDQKAQHGFLPSNFDVIVKIHRRQCIVRGFFGQFD